MGVLLLGDSHLARVRRDLPRVAGGQDEVVNAAVGGATAEQLAAQVAGLAVGSSDRVVVSIGTNDAAPWSGVPLERFTDLLEQLVAGRQPERWVYLAPPGLLEAARGPSDRTGAGIARYRTAAEFVFASVGGVTIDTPTLLAPVGDRAFAPDGLHLSGAGYDAVLPALADACGDTPTTS